MSPILARVLSILMVCVAYQNAGAQIAFTQLAKNTTPLVAPASVSWESFEDRHQNVAASGANAAYPYDSHKSYFASPNTANPSNEPRELAWSDVKIANVHQSPTAESGFAWGKVDQRSQAAEMRTFQETGAGRLDYFDSSPSKVLSAAHQIHVSALPTNLRTSAPDALVSSTPSSYSLSDESFTMPAATAIARSGVISHDMLSTQGGYPTPASPSFSLIPWEQIEDTSLASAAIPSRKDAGGVDGESFMLETFKLLDEPKEETLIPINLLQFEPVVSQDTSASLGMKYSLAEMTGPMSSGAVLLNRVNATRDFREEAAVPQNARRQESDLLGFGPEWIERNYSIVSPVFYHHPLYFEQVNMERYGLAPKRCLQPVAAGGHFLASLSLLPYKMFAQPPCEKVYTLGYTRPGSCAGFQKRSVLGQAKVGE